MTRTFVLLVLTSHIISHLRLTEWLDSCKPL